jgi:hypothetical protein
LATNLALGFDATDLALGFGSAAAAAEGFFERLFVVWLTSLRGAAFVVLGTGAVIFTAAGRVTFLAGGFLGL